MSVLFCAAATGQPFAGRNDLFSYLRLARLNGVAMPRFRSPFHGELAMDSKENQWAMALHLSQLAHFVVIVPFAGFIAPILIWQLKKGEFPGLDVHGKIV